MQIATADSWHETRTGSGGITYIGEPHTLEFCRCNIWRVKGGDADLLEEGDIVDFSDRHFAVLHIPRHSPGSSSFPQTNPQQFHGRHAPRSPPRTGS